MQTKVLGYLGPEGTFSQQAAQNVADSDTQLKEYPTIISAIKAVDTGEIDSCIVPIENSLNGSISATLDTLAFDSDVYISGEYVLRITQNLIVKPNTKKDDIKVIMSHPQALGQSSRLLEKEFCTTELKAVSSTAAAAKCVYDSDGTIAAIAPKSAADLYGLEIMYPSCNDTDNNFTRFAIITKMRNMTVTTHDKSSIVFSVDHTPGSLYNALGLLGEQKINMLKIESRPMKNELGRYVFFIDIEGNLDNAKIYFALDEIKKHSLFYKFLGSYQY